MLNSARLILRTALPAILVGAAIISGCVSSSDTSPDIVSKSTIAAVEEPDSLVDVSDTPALPLDRALAPKTLRIPALETVMPVTPMEWTIATVNGERTTKSIVPDTSVGWHVNSAGAGAAGSTLLSAHQAQGDALFAPLALGQIEPGQELVLVDEDDVAFVYRVTEVSAPIPVTNASEAETATIDSYLAPSETGRLVLITGWPDFTTTHRVFAVADYVGVAK